MPSYVDASEAIRRKKLTTIYNANKAADPLKFRALTAFSAYDTAVPKMTGEVCNDSCVTTVKGHHTFAATKFAVSKIAYYNR